MGTRWRGMLAPINAPTGDGRRIASGGFTHRPLPLPLKWQRSDTQGHDDSVVIGSLEKIDIDEANNAVWGEGELFDDVSPATNPRLAEDVNEVKLLLAKKVIGPSVDPGAAHGMTVIQGRDEPATDAQFEHEWRTTGEAPATEVLFTGYEIAAATLVPIPAFAECRPFELLAAIPSALTAAARDALLADAPALPPLDPSLFQDPELAQITPLTREPLGNGWTRVYGHIATHDVCHIGIPGTCTTAPYSDCDYQEFHRYDSTIDDAIEFPLPVGRLTAAYGALSDACMCCRGNDDHACDRLSLGAAIAHHDLMQVLAYGRVGEDEANNAIWFSGVQAPDLGQEGIALLARQKVSGDWRPYAGSLELTEVLVLSHRNPGFPLPRVAMRRRRQTALVAAGTVRPRHEDESDVDALGELPPALARLHDAFDALGRQMAEAFESLAYNAHQRRGPNNKWIKMGIPGLHADAPKVRPAHNGTTTTPGLLPSVTAAAKTGGWADLPVASDDRTWDADAAKARLAEWAGEDMAKYGRAFLWHDGDPKLKGSYKFPIADVIDGELTIVPAGVRAAASYLSKGNIPAAAKEKIRGTIDTLMERIHGAVTAAAPEGGHTGAMIALRMTEQDAARLAATGGLPIDELHTTLCYLGESDQITPEMRGRILADMRELAASQPGPIPGDGFALNAFNPGTANNRETAIVMGVGGQELADLHQAASEAWEGWGDDGTWAMPEQHSPWVPHVTLQYTDDLNAVKTYADRVGPLAYDRLRVAFGDEVTDIPFGPGVADVVEDDPNAVEAVVRPTMSAEMCGDCDKMATACADCAECAAKLATRAGAGVTALRAALAQTELVAALAAMPPCCG